jgi:large repetitive protein
MKKLYILLFIIISTVAFSQNYAPSTNTTITTCSGNFYDSGGSGLNAAGAYSNSQDYTVTFCPSIPGNKINLNFTDFLVEDGWDFMYIYDGPNTSSPSLGTYSGTLTPIGNVQATTTNTSGCITIRFDSDFTGTEGGWRAVISCVTPCETINSTLVSSNPAAGAGGIIRVCQGQSVTFNGGGTFSSGSSAGASYTWNLDNGATPTGTTATTTYNTPGVYVVNLNINKGGCINYNKINQIVQVSTTPSFAGTTTSTTSICLGQTATLIGSVTPTPYIANCTPPIAGTTFLPDGSGTSYNTCITVDCFNSGQTVTSANDVANICLTMEHSYLGDLQIEIVCPNGQTVPLKTYAQGGGGLYLGNPIDNTTGGPGTGSQYCFSMSGSTQLVSGPTVSSGSPAGNSIQAGTYAPQSSFAGLIGCPLNGSWCIKVTDNLAADDGYIFGWDVNFASGIVPASQSFTPSIVSQTWSGPNIISTSGNNATIQPTVTGSVCYTLTAVDNFNCSYTTQRCITVNNSPTITINPSATLTCGGTVALSSTVAPASTISWTGPGVVSGGNTTSPTVNAAGIYTITATAAGCSRTATINVVAPTITITATSPTICAGSSSPLSASGATTYSWSPSTGLSATTGATVTANPTVTTTYTVRGTTGSCTGTFVTTVVVNPRPQATLTFTNPTCGNNNGVILITNTSPALPAQTISTYTSNLGTMVGQTVTGLGASSPIITLTNNFGCTFTVSATLTMTPGPSNFSLTAINTTCGNTNGSLTFGTPTGGTAPFTYAINGGAFTATSPTNSLTTGTYSVTVRDANNCTYTRTVTINNTAGPTAISGTTTPAGCSMSNGSYTITGVTGGTPTFSYSVDGGALTTSSVTTGLAGGTHSVMVRDANGCTFNTTFNIGSTSGPSAATVTIVPPSCGMSNGTATVTSVVGGLAPIQYSFDGGAFALTNNTSGLSAGTHSVIIRDANSCTITVSYSVTNPGAPTGTVIGTSSVVCNGGATGGFTINTSGGTPGYGYTITPTGAANTLGIFNGLAAQTYTINVRDAAGCTYSLVNTVTQPTALTLTLTPQAVSCNGASDGTITASAANGTAPYQYSLDGGAYQAGATFSGLTSGTHSITVRDNNNCTLTLTTTITQPAPLAITFTNNPTACLGSTGTATIGVTYCCCSCRS